MVESWIFDDGKAAEPADAALRRLRKRIAAGQLETWLTSSAGRSLGVISNTDRARILVMGHGARWAQMHASAIAPSRHFATVTIRPPPSNSPMTQVHSDRCGRAIG